MDPAMNSSLQIGMGFTEAADPDSDFFYDLKDVDLEKAWEMLLVKKQSDNGTADDRNSDLFKLALDYLGLYFMPCIIVVGLVGNTMSFSVFTFTHLQRLSSSFYLSTLAMADIGFLMSLTLVWLQRVGVELYASDGWCQTVQYTRHVCGFLSVWTVVSFTAERYIIVYHPLRKDTFCTKKKARVVVLLLVVLSLLYYTFIIVTYEAVRFPGLRAACFPLPNYFDVSTIMTSIDVVIGCVIPSVTIVVLNIKIMMKIHQYQKRTSEVAAGIAMLSPERLYRRSAGLASVSTTGSMHIKFSTTRPSAQTRDLQEMTSPDRCSRLVKGRSHFRTARMLLVLSSVFVMLNLPFHVFRTLRMAESLFGGHRMKIPKDKMKWTELFELLYFLNFAINFFIYSLCGQQFRSGLTRLCRRVRYRLNKFVEMLRTESKLKRKRSERDDPVPVNIRVRVN